jgi:NTE family protein
MDVCAYFPHAWPAMEIDFNPPIGLALGSGAARGWSHIGVIRALHDARITPEIVCGSSAGAVVGAFYAAGELDAFERWVRDLGRRQIMGYMDPTLRGGLIKARKVFEALAEHLPDRPIESLPIPFAAVATDLSNGHEVWLREGSLLDALRATVALPGLVKPEYLDGRWLVDGGLVNPVPVSLCRAMGAGSVIAVDLNTTLLVQRQKAAQTPQVKESVEAEKTGRVVADEVKVGEAEEIVDDASLFSSDGAARLLASFQDAAGGLLDQFGFDGSTERVEPSAPSIFDVISNSINIMQTRIGRSRLAGDPPELLITPRLEDFALLDFDRADEAIVTGRRAVAHALAAR